MLCFCALTQENLCRRRAYICLLHCNQVPPLSDIFILTPFPPTDGAVPKLRHLSVSSPKFPPDVRAGGGQDLLTSIGQK